MLRIAVVASVALAISGAATLPASARPKEEAQRKGDWKVQVCHRPPGNENRPRAIEVGSERALLAHLEHGDRLFGWDLEPDCSGSPRFLIDTGLEPRRPTVGGLDGGPPRAVGVLESSDGRRDEFVVAEADFKPVDPAELSEFLARYDAEILRGDVVLVMNEDRQLEELPGIGWYQIRIDPRTSSLVDLPQRAASLGFEGDFALSSGEAARTFAAILREAHRTITPNLVLEQTAVLDHPRVENPRPGFPVDYVDFSVYYDMTEEEDRGLSVGIVRAWEYLRHTGLPPENGVWDPARVAIIDMGFHLVDGIGSPDYLFNPPLQVDLQDYDGDAGVGENGDEAGWHGEKVFGICCAFPNNGYGGAGGGGEYVRAIPILIPSTTIGIANGVGSAALMAADVINISLTAICGSWCEFEFLVRQEWRLQEWIETAGVLGSVVVAGAGNGNNRDISDEEVPPCKMRDVICVGAIDRDGWNVYDFGAGVDIWAPHRSVSTTTPDFTSEDANDYGSDELALFFGTSSATPVISGVVGMMKAAAPDLRWDVAQQILQETANASGDPRVASGYVDALRAVQAVRANPPPLVDVLGPADQLSWFPEVQFLVTLDDPPAPSGFVGSVHLHSDVEGEICADEGDLSLLACSARLETLGSRVLTATATDEFGAIGEDVVRFEVVNDAPTVTLSSPADGSTRSADQAVRFRASVADFDGEVFQLPCPAEPGSACVRWSSDVDGDLTPPGFGPKLLNFARVLSLGTHTITVAVEDGKGATDQASAAITITAGTGLPSAEILSAQVSGSSAGKVATLVGRGSDPEDGGLSGASLRWSSSFDGFLGTGGTIETVLGENDCVNTEHVITLEVTDSDGNVDEDTVVILLESIDPC